MKKLQILMSTYNGGKYLAEQLDSLIGQTVMQSGMVDLSILVRDDGSGDSTTDILRDYAKQYEQVRYVAEANCGVIESFFRLVDMADEDADYLAFCDQDDVWMPEKMERALEKICETEDEKGAELPVLYCGRPLLTDAELNPIDTVLYTGEVRPGFGNAILENIVYGCTSVVNRGMIRLLRMGHPAFTVMHDRWFYLLASCFGEVIFDPESYICYRQHEVNTVGVKKNYYQEFRERLSKFKKTKHEISRQAQAFLDFVDENALDMDPEKRKWLEEVSAMPGSMQSRIHAMKNKHLYRQRGGDNAVFRVLMLLGHL